MKRGAKRFGITSLFLNAVRTIFIVLCVGLFCVGIAGLFGGGIFGLVLGAIAIVLAAMGITAAFVGSNPLWIVFLVSTALLFVAQVRIASLS